MSRYTAQLEEIADLLVEVDGVLSVSVGNDRIRINHGDGRVHYVSVNNDGRDRFFELRDTTHAGVITTVDLPVETDLLVDQIVSFL